MLVWCDEYDEVFLNDNDLKKAKHSGKAYLKISDSYTPVNAAGLPTPYDLTHDEKWNEGGEFLMEYDLQLKIKPKRDSVFNGVYQVLTPHLNTSQDNEPVNNIQDLNDDDAGVKVLTPFQKDDRNIFEESQEGPGNDGNGEGIEDPNKQVRVLSEKFTALMDSNTPLTPYLCRKGCKHYDSVGEWKSIDFKEFCWKSDNSKIERNRACKNFESKYPNLAEGVMTF